MNEIINKGRNQTTKYGAYFNNYGSSDMFVGQIAFDLYRDYEDTEPREDTIEQIEELIEYHGSELIRLYEKAQKIVKRHTNDNQNQRR